MRNHSISLIVLLAGTALSGCGSATEPVAPPVTDGSAETQSTATAPGGSAESNATTPGTSQTTPPKREFKPVVIGGMGGSTQSTSAEPTIAATMSVQDVIDQLKPIQVIMGQWRGTTRKDYGVSKAVDAHEWIWDLTTAPNKPALIMTSDKSPYIKAARITSGGTVDQFAMTVTTPEGVTRQLAGTFVEPVKDVAGDDNKLHRTFKLQFEQTGDDKEKWRYTYHQQENNRYLLEVDRRRGKAAFRRYDTVSTQREGTSFAVSDSDYGEKTCIISQGLGTIAVSYNGKQYWVCCSGCKAAFEDDPKKWIAAAAKRSQEEAMK